MRDTRVTNPEGADSRVEFDFDSSHDTGTTDHGGPGSRTLDSRTPLTSRLWGCWVLSGEEPTTLGSSVGVADGPSWSDDRDAVGGTGRTDTSYSVRRESRGGPVAGVRSWESLDGRPRHWGRHPSTCTPLAIPCRSLFPESRPKPGSLSPNSFDLKRTYLRESSTPPSRSQSPERNRLPPSFGPVSTCRSVDPVSPSTTSRNYPEDTSPVTCKQTRVCTQASQNKKTK